MALTQIVVEKKERNTILNCYTRSLQGTDPRKRGILEKSWIFISNSVWESCLSQLKKSVSCRFGTKTDTGRIIVACVFSGSADEC